MQLSKKRQQFKEREADILKACRTWLDSHGYLSWRMPIGPVLRGGGKAPLVFGSNPLKGFPDLCGILKKRAGILFAVEVKTSVGTISPFQRAWHWRLRGAGVVVIVARSLEEMVKAIEAAEGS